MLGHGVESELTVAMASYLPVLAMSTQTGSTGTARIGATSSRGEGRGRLAGAGGYPQKMQVGSRSISVSRSSIRFDGVSGS
jgi:hypothetical protein